MNFHIPFTANDETTNRIQETSNRLQDEGLRLRQNLVNATRQQVIEPAMHAAEKAGAMARGAYYDTRDTVSKELALAKDIAARQSDKAARWVSANPLTAIGLAFAVGAVFMLSGRSKAR